MSSVSLDFPDAEELADFLRFLIEWLTTDHDGLSDSLARFMVHRRKSGELVEPGRRRLVLPRSD
jgi:hypothetical protein